METELGVFCTELNINAIHVEIPEVENNNDYKQVKSQEAK